MISDGFENQDCITCFVKFRVPTGFTEQCRRDRVTFYCPNGHHMGYPKDGRPEDQLRRERDRLTQQLAQRDDEIKRQRELREAAERQASAARGQITKLKKRASGGVCPCCNRTFLELQRHMATKHPTFTAEEVAHENVVSLIKARAS